MTKLLPKGCPPIKEIVHQLERKHELIRDDFYCSAGMRLMYLEAEIAEKIMIHLARQGILALPIHDSFLVWCEDEDDHRLKRTMRDVFYEKTGQTCGITADPMPEDRRDDQNFKEIEADYSVYFQMWNEWPYSDPMATKYLEKNWPEVLEWLRGGPEDEYPDDIEWEPA